MATFIRNPGEAALLRRHLVDLFREICMNIPDGPREMIRRMVLWPYHIRGRLMDNLWLEDAAGAEETPEVFPSCSALKRRASFIGDLEIGTNIRDVACGAAGYYVMDQSGKVRLMSPHIGYERSLLADSFPGGHLCASTMQVYAVQVIDDHFHLTKLSFRNSWLAKTPKTYRLPIPAYMRRENLRMEQIDFGPMPWGRYHVRSNQYLYEYRYNALGECGHGPQHKCLALPPDATVLRLELFGSYKYILPDGSRHHVYKVPLVVN